MFFVARAEPPDTFANSVSESNQVKYFNAAFKKSDRSGSMSMQRTKLEHMGGSSRRCWLVFMVAVSVTSEIGCMGCKSRKSARF